MLVSGSDEGAGYITVCGEQFAVKVATKGAGSLECCPRLNSLLAGHERAVKQRLAFANDVESFVRELVEFTERLLQAAPPTRLPPSAFYDLLVSEIDQIGWGAVSAISPALDELQLTALDSARRCHTLTLELPPDYPRTAPRARAVLPTPFVAVKSQRDAASKKVRWLSFRNLAQGYC